MVIPSRRWTKAKIGKQRKKLRAKPPRFAYTCGRFVDRITEWPIRRSYG
jgi:hypothetical protein